MNDPATFVIEDRELADAGLMIGSAVGAMNLLGVVIIVLHSSHASRTGFHPLALTFMALFGTGSVIWAKRHPISYGTKGLPLVLVFGVIALTVEAWWFGPQWGPYVAMSYLWVGMGANLALGRAGSLATVGLVGVAYGLLVALQPGNPAPFTQWTIVMGLVLVSGSLFGTLAGRIRHLTSEERRLRIDVDRDREHLQVANRQRDEFLAGMSHELRTPLNAVMGFAGVLAERLFGSLTTPQEQEVSRILRAGSSLLGLVDEVLDREDPSVEAVGGAPAVDDDDGLPVLDRAPALQANARGSAAFFLLVPIALLTFPRPAPAGFRLGPLIAIALAGAGVDALVLLVHGLRPTMRASAHLAVATLTAVGLAGAAGAPLAPFATMVVVWMATAAFIRLPRKLAVAHLVLISVAVGVLIALQPGNTEPFVRWEMTTGTIVASALAIRSIVTRLFDLAEQEARTRRSADRARAELELADRHKVEFLRSVRHEMRAPIDTVTAAATALLEGTAGPLDAKQAEYASDIASAGRHLWSLVNDILDLATAESGAMVVDVSEIAIGAPMHEVVETFRGQADAAGVTLSVRIGPNVDEVCADAAKLRRAVAALISNAIKFTPRGGAVELSVAAAAELVRIAVSDTGPGIPVEDRARIFERFQQGASSTSAPGVGVGLTLTQRFVELQGGTVELTSKPGQGSTFTIVLPSASSKVALTPNPSAPRKWRPAGRGAPIR